MNLDRPFEDIKIGDQAVFVKTFDEEAVEGFAHISGDSNQIHLCEEFASRSMFKKRIVHGMLTASLISTVFGTILPGANTIYLSQDLRFLAPVFIDDTVRAEVIVVDKNDLKRTLSFTTDIYNQDGKKVISGRATVMKPMALSATA